MYTLWARKKVLATMSGLMATLTRDTGSTTRLLNGTVLRRESMNGVMERATLESGTKT